MKFKTKQTEMYLYGKLLLMPILISSFGSALWVFLEEYICIAKGDQGIFEPILSVIGVAHGLIASLQIQKVNNQQDAIKVAFLTKDLALLKANIHTRISPVIKLLLFVFSVIFYFIFLVYPFESQMTGIIMTFVVMFILYILWEVAIELDDPFHGVWKITKKDIVDAFGEDALKELHL
jgi:hypothetical protein